MKALEIVNTLLEAEEIDPKDFLDQVQWIYHYTVRVDEDDYHYFFRSFSTSYPPPYGTKVGKEIHDLDWLEGLADDMVDKIRIEPEQKEGVCWARYLGVVV